MAYRPMIFSATRAHHADDDGLLHPFLDTGMFTKNANAHYGGSSETYASALATRITVKLTHVSRFY